MKTPLVSHHRERDSSLAKITASGSANLAPTAADESQNIIFNVSTIHIQDGAMLTGPIHYENTTVLGVLCEKLMIQNSGKISISRPMSIFSIDCQEFQLKDQGSVFLQPVLASKIYASKNL